MMKTAARIRDNFDVLEGTYFDERIDLGDYEGVSSSVFPDIGWNYIYPIVRTPVPLNMIAGKSRERLFVADPPIVFDPNEITDDKFPSTVSVEGDYSVWMSCTPEGLSTRGSATDFSIYGRGDRIPPDAIKCFREAYTNGLPDQIGYNDLDDTYPAGFKRMHEVGERCTLLTIEEDGTTAAVASIVMHPKGDIAGLYNVAVRPSKRKRGFGREISKAATELAFTKGATECILQTDSHTKVEELYHSLGYRPDFYLQYAMVPQSDG